MRLARPPLRRMIAFEGGSAHRALYNCEKCGTIAPPISEMGVRSCLPR